MSMRCPIPPPQTHRFSSQTRANSAGPSGCSCVSANALCLLFSYSSVEDKCCWERKPIKLTENLWMKSAPPPLPRFVRYERMRCEGESANHMGHTFCLMLGTLDLLRRSSIFLQRCVVYGLIKCRWWWESVAVLDSNIWYNASSWPFSFPDPDTNPFQS